MIDLSKYKDLFVSETEDHLQKLNDNLLALEKKPDDKKLLDKLMRSSHTIKGSSATMGYKKIAFLTHVMEDVFDYARNDTLKITPKIIDELFKTEDLLEKSLASIKKSGKELDVDATAKKLKKLTGVETEGTGKSARSSEGKPIRGFNAGQDQTTVSAADKTEDRDQYQIGVEDPHEVQRITHIKVPVARLDNLMDLIEELLIDKMRLGQLKKKDSELEGVVDHLSRLVSDIQYQVMQARLVPVEQIFARFPRMVRDLAQEQKKNVELEITVSEMELDRTIVDKLGEPLVHLLRNAIDHGIEKSGTIRLKALREKDFALIVVENEGRSIDFEKVRQAAVRRNIVSSKEVESFDNKQLINLLYHGRLSTKDKVTETSGRGIGLSVVKNFVDQIGGRVIVESPVFDSGGTRFTLELPLTLAIINALLVEVENSIFAIPFSSIERSVVVGANNIKSMADQDIAVVDEIEVPLVRLDKMFNLVDSGKPRTFSELAESGTEAELKSKKVRGKDANNAKNLKSKAREIVVLVKRGKETAGIVVDKLINQQEIIVKSLPSVLRGTKGFSGSTILGNGQTVLILDVVSLLEDTSKFIRTS